MRRVPFSSILHVYNITKILFVNLKSCQIMSSTISEYLLSVFSLRRDTHQYIYYQCSVLDEILSNISVTNLILQIWHKRHGIFFNGFSPEWLLPENGFSPEWLLPRNGFSPKMISPLKMLSPFACNLLKSFPFCLLYCVYIYLILHT